MKRITFICIFILTQIFFIFYQINKHNQLIKLSYTKQRYENEIKELNQKKQDLTQRLCDLKKSSTIKKYAQEKFCMARVGIKQIRRIN